HPDELSVSDGVPMSVTENVLKDFGVLCRRYLPSGIRLVLLADSHERVLGHHADKERTGEQDSSSVVRLLAVQHSDGPQDSAASARLRVRLHQPRGCWCHARPENLGCVEVPERVK